MAGYKAPNRISAEILVFVIIATADKSIKFGLIFKRTLQIFLNFKTCRRKREKTRVNTYF
jgi:hypothetical protein